MRIQHNIAALNSHRQLGGNNSAVSKNLEKLSSGYRINRAGDDAAGLAISEKMRAQIKGLETASKNAEDGVSLIQTAEGALTEVHSMLNRMVELTTQAANGTYGTNERQKVQDEVDALTDEINRIADATDFNGTKLLNGTLGGYKMTTDGTTALDFKDNGLKNLVVQGGSLSDEDILGQFAMGADGAVTFDTTNISIGGNDLSAISDLTKVIKIEGNGTILNSGGSANIKITIDKNALEKAFVDDTVAEADQTTLRELFSKLDGISITATAGRVKDDGTFEEYAAANMRVTADESGSIGNGLTLQVGDTNDTWQKVNVGVLSMKASDLGVGSVNVGSDTAAAGSIKSIKDAIEKVSTQRGQLGALQNRLDHTINNLGVTTENMTAAESRIRDVDMAKEMMDFTKNNILTQAAQAMLAQANQIPQGVLQLLQ